MSNELFQNKYRISSARATWHDYNGGAYFITVCTKNREHYFGEICRRDVAYHVSPENAHDCHKNVAGDYKNVAGDCRDVACHVSTGETIMQLTKIGQYLHENLQNATIHYPYAEIPLYVVVPNHWHAIIFIDDDKIPVKNCRDVARHVSPENANDCRENVAGDCRDVARHVSTEKMRNIRNQQGFLSVVVGGIKSAITKYANENKIEFAWQTRFNDRIIRNQKSMNNIAEYIENNVERWDKDCFNNIIEK